MRKIFLTTVFLASIATGVNAQVKTKNIQKTSPSTTIKNDQGRKIEPSTQLKITSVIKEINNKGGIKLTLVHDPNGMNEEAIKNVGNPKPNKALSDKEGLICSTIQKKIDLTSDQFSTASLSAIPKLEDYLPGAIVTEENFLKNNFSSDSWVATENRNKIRLTPSGISSGKTKDSVVADFSNISNAIIDFKTKGFSKSGNSKSTNGTAIRIVHSSSKGASEIALSGGAKGWGATIKGSYDEKIESNSVTFKADAYRVLFTVSASKNKDYFKELPSNIRKEDLVLINHVSYGVRLSVDITVEYESKETAAKMAAEYKGGMFSANADFKSITGNKNSKVRFSYFQVGGNQADYATAVKKSSTVNDVSVDAIYDKIDEVLQSANFSNVVPLVYTATTLDGKPLGIRTTSDTFEETICVPADEVLEKAYIEIHTGNDGKNEGNRLQVKLTPNKNNDSLWQNDEGGPFAATVYNAKIDDEGRAIIYLDVKEGAKISDFIKKNGGFLTLYFENSKGNDNVDIHFVGLYLEGNNITKQGWNAELKGLAWNKRRKDRNGKEIVGYEIPQATPKQKHFRFPFDKNFQAQQVEVK